jgi:hypothetical protein
MPDLLIDRTAATRRLSEEEVHGWAAGKRVFISSVMASLREERRAAAEAIRALGATPVWFEEFGGRDQDAEQAYLSEVASSDVYVGILGTRYGRQDPATGYSATHAEYREALERGLRVSVWVLDVDDMEGHQQSFLEEVRTYYTTGSATSPEDLARGVGERLRTIAAEDVAPWCKIGRIVLRADRIRDTGTELEITGEVHDPAVAHALTELRPALAGGGQPLQVVFGDTVATARVDRVEFTTTAGISRTLAMALTMQDARPSPSSLLGMSYTLGGDTYSPGDLTEIAVRSALFGEPNPLGHSSFLGEITDPLQPLRTAAVSEEVLRPILRLLLVESLVGSGRARRVTEFRLGPPGPGGRPALIGWEIRPQHRDEQPDRRRVEGTVQI